MTENGNPSQSTIGDSYNVCSAKAMSSGKRVLKGCLDSAMAKKRIKRTTYNNQIQNEFLEYLLNFDPKDVFEIVKDVDRPSLQQNEDASKDEQSALDVYQKVPSETVFISDTNNESSQECSISLLSPHLNELIDSCLQGKFKEDTNVQSSGAIVESPLQSEELFDSSSSASLPLLMAKIHNQGLTCSPEFSEINEPLEEFDTTNKQLADTKTSKGPCAQSTSPAIESIYVDRTSGWSKNYVNTPHNDLTQISLQELHSSNRLFLEKPLNQNEETDVVTVQNQQGVVEITETALSTSQTQMSKRSYTENPAMECDTLILNPIDLIVGPKAEPHLSCRWAVNELEIEANACAVLPFLSCARVDVEHPENSHRADFIVESDPLKNSVDSDCTVVEWSNATDIQDVAITSIQPEVSGCEETHSEKEAENMDGTPDTVVSVSVLSSLLPENLCAHPSLDNTEEKAHLKQDPHIAFEIKGLFNTGEQTRRKKTSKWQKRRSRKKTNALKTGDSLELIICYIITIQSMLLYILLFLNSIKEGQADFP